MRQKQSACRQRGQALAFVLVFAAITGLAVLLLYNSSQLANTKTKLQNAADAGAYAAAILQARDHNFSAYTNRAMIANQVAVAQFASLKSYLDDASLTQKRMNDSIFHWFYQLFPQSKGAWDAAADLPISSAFGSSGSGSSGASSAAITNDQMKNIGNGLKNINNLAGSSSDNALLNILKQNAANNLESAVGDLRNQNDLDPQSNSNTTNTQSDNAQSSMSGFIPTAIKALDTLIAALQTAQEAAHLATVTGMANIADNVVKLNDPQAKVTQSAIMGARITSWDASYTKKLGINTSAGDRFADVVLDKDSSDEFIRNRSGSLNASWSSQIQYYLRLLPAVCPTPIVDSTFTIFGFSHGGGTILSQNKTRWLALDATQGAGFASCTYWTVCGCPFCYPCRKTNTIVFPDINLDTEPTPVMLGGSGGALVGKDGGYNNETTGYQSAQTPKDSANYGGALINPTVSLPALYRWGIEGPGSSIDPKGGLTDYRDIANFSTPKNQTSALNGDAFPITVEVARPIGSMRLSSALLPNSVDIRMDDAAKGNTMQTVASASAYFFRPQNDDSNMFTMNGWKRADGKTEMASLFSPYWQAHLVDTPAADVQASITGQ